VKTASPDLVAYINAARTAPDATIAFAECFTFRTTTGAVYAWSNFDLPLSYAGLTYLADGPLVSGLKYKASAGLEVDKQQLIIAARPTDLINGASFLQALRDGVFDGAAVKRDRLFLSGPAWLQSSAIGGFMINQSAIGAAKSGEAVAVIGGVTMFKGRIATVDQVGRTRATVTVASDLIVLDNDMPRNLFSQTCVHTLYDTGCGVIRGTFAASGTAGAGSSQNQILSGVAAAVHAQGSLVFSSGANANVRATVKAVAGGVALYLMYPLPFAPAAGDSFTVYAGCDHTLATCQTRFNNKANFRGFPFTPPIEMAY